MTTRLLLFALLCASSSRSSAARTDMPSVDGWRDVRVLYEFARVDFVHIDTADEDWAVTRVIQGPPISENFIPAAAQANARQWGLIADLVNATADPVATLRGTVADGPWPCFAPVPARILFEIRPLFMEDQTAGTCVCRVNGKVPGAGRAVLEESRLIPDDWVTQMKPAFEKWRASREVFIGPIDPPRRKQLLDLTKDNNPVIAFMAYRRLAESGELAPADVPPATLAARTDLGIFVAFLLLQYSSDDLHEDVFQRMVKQVDSAYNIEDLHGIATACAYDAEIGNRRVDKQASARLLARIETRAVALSKDGKPDDYLAPAMKQLHMCRRLLDRLEKGKADLEKRRGGGRPGTPSTMATTQPAPQH